MIIIDKKESDISIVKNKLDNRFYLSIKKCKYVLPIEVSCDNLVFKSFDSLESIKRDTSENVVSILRDEFGQILMIGANQFLYHNQFGSVCEFNSQGNLDHCINMKYVYEVDSVGGIKVTYLY